MKKFIQTITLATTLFCGAALADLERGIEALNKGDFEVALSEFTYLVENDYGPAMFYLGDMYENGYGVLRDYDKAIELYQRAIKQDVTDAMFALASMYHFGEGVKKDHSKAAELYKQAAKNGLAAAQFNLGVMYANGEGVMQDFIEAKTWYLKAAAQNYTDAQFNLALLYFEGQGAEKSIEKSYIWNTIAEYNGHKRASHSRKLDERKLSPSQAKQAREKADVIYEKIQKGEFFDDRNL